MSVQNNLSTDVLQLISKLKKGEYKKIYDHNTDHSCLSVLWINGELILYYPIPNDHIILQRLYPLHYIDFKDLNSISVHKRKTNTYEITFRTIVADVDITIKLLDSSNEQPIININVSLAVLKEHRFKKVNRELIVCTKDYDLPNQPDINLHQIEGRTGHCFTDFGKNKKGYLIYLQDLGALKKVAEHAQVSLMDTVKFEWPQLGFKIAKTKAVLQKGENYCIQNNLIGFYLSKSNNPHRASEAYLKCLKIVYPLLDKPKIQIADTFELANKVISDLLDHKGCWKQVENAVYLNAYINSYETPPESMVQTAILSPLFEFQTQLQNAKAPKIINDISQNLTHFFDEQLDIIHRWLPAESYLLNFDEEQKRSFIMDSWYLLYPLLQLASLFELGFKNEELQNQFERSLKYIQKTAKQFNYQWPIFYHLYTLEILKEEGNPNEYEEIVSPFCIPPISAAW